MANETRNCGNRTRPTRVIRRLFAIGAVIVATAGIFVATAGVAQATGLSSIVCGGVKYGNGWYTKSVGGYVGENCGAGIDEIKTPTSSFSEYNFGVAPAGATYNFDAWIPTNYEDNAKMDFTLWACGQQLQDTYVNQFDNSGWVTLFSLTNWPGCTVVVDAWSGMASSGYVMGLDAISSHTESGTREPNP